MNIAVDAMGGDKAPRATVEGAILAYREYGIPTILVGNERLIQGELTRHHIKDDKLQIHHATQVAGMAESPTDILRKKKDASICVALELIKKGEAQAVVSAGSSGATLAGAIFILGKLKNVDRPALAGVFPTLKGPTVMIDVGANVHCKSLHLVQFGIMASIFAENILGIKNPRVGLLNIGEEDSKGNRIVREAYETLRKSNLNFVGNVEGREIFTGNLDVVVCDGFVGNICLKLSEGLAEATGIMLKNEIKKNLLAKFGYFLARNAFYNFRKRVDYSEYGGVPLLGINGIVIICHGISTPKAIKNAIRVAKGLVEKKVNEHLLIRLKEFSESKNYNSK